MISKANRKTYLMLAIFVAAVFLFSFFACQNASQTATSPLGITIVIDAGHGGADGGSVGTTTGITESELNLKYAKKLTEYLQNCGFDVVNTRETMDGLYDNFDQNYKQNDMQKRSDIINNSGAQLLVSIHMNKFPSSAENGAQVFFKQESEDGEKMANNIRDMLCANFDNARELTLAGDYYILNCTNITGVIIECGFLSNPTEEQNLQQESYINKMCYSIYAGIVKYVGVNNY